NLCDTLTRRRESYHANIAAGGGGREGTKLEDQIAAKESGLESYLIYDRRVRETFAEWFLPQDTTFDAWRAQSFEPAFTAVFSEPVLRRRKNGVEVSFQAEVPWGDGHLGVVKTFAFDSAGGTLGVRWALRARGTG